MATQGLEKRPQGAERSGLVERLGLGFATRRMLSLGSLPWRRTITRHEPAPWPEARLSLQARIAALDFADLAVQARAPASSQ
jgi:hypothetical protein